jgi:hypothetical protein
VRAPVALLIFNRPELTRRVFAAVAAARPSRLLVVADGPRSGREDDVRRCADARAVVDRVDWPCEVLTNFADRNMGCGMRVSRGLEWVFQQVDEAIVLEDDCLPDSSFFAYCDELLERYRDDQRIMHISGDQFISSDDVNPFSYSFSRYPLSWGWATWRRAFRHYDFGIRLWPELRETRWLMNVLGDETAVSHWRTIFDRTLSQPDQVNTWDFQWVFACWVQSGLSILPRANLVSNIGYGADATHTKNEADRRANLHRRELRVPLEHPNCIVPDATRDRLIFERVVASVPRRRLLDRTLGSVASRLPASVRRTLSEIKASWSSVRAGDAPAGRSRSRQAPPA